MGPKTGTLIPISQYADTNGAEFVLNSFFSSTKEYFVPLFPTKHQRFTVRTL